MENQESHEGNEIPTGFFSQPSTPPLPPPITELGVFGPRCQSSCRDRVLFEAEISNCEKNGAEGRAADSNGFTESGTTIGEKIGELYDKKGLYSDVQFIVGLSSSSSSPEPSSSSSSASQSQTSTSTSMERRATHHEVETIPAHKLILALATPVFASMFYSDLAESSTSIRAPDCTPSAFKIALQFIYKGKDSAAGAGAAELDIEEFADILYVARKYCLVGLEEEVVDALQARLSPSTILPVLRIVEFYELSTLGGKCWAFIQRNTWEFLKECTKESQPNGGSSSQSSRLDQRTLAQILDLEAVNATEVQLFEQLLKWAKLECTERELDGENPAVVNGVIGDLIRLIRFPTMTGADFADIVVPTGLLSSAQAVSIFTIINGEKKKREREAELSEFSTIPRKFLGTPPCRPFPKTRRTEFYLRGEQEMGRGRGILFDLMDMDEMMQADYNAEPDEHFMRIVPTSRAQGGGGGRRGGGGGRSVSRGGNGPAAPVVSTRRSRRRSSRQQ